jgi:hypothetical protein
MGSEDALQAKPFTSSENVNGGGFRNGTCLFRGLMSIGEGISAVLECGVGALLVGMVFCFCRMRWLRERQNRRSGDWRCQELHLTHPCSGWYHYGS